MPEIPADLTYSTDRLWVRPADGTSLVRAGVTDFAQQSLGDVVEVTPPSPGDTITAGEACGDIESVKSGVPADRQPADLGGRDVTGGPPYVYTAAAQGSAAAANAVFHAERAVDYAALLRITFTSPAIASAGLTEAELVRQGGSW